LIFGFLILHLAGGWRLLGLFFSLDNNHPWSEKGSLSLLFLLHFLAWRVEVVHSWYMALALGCEDPIVETNVQTTEEFLDIAPLSISTQTKNDIIL
jgi:hypothetical protein